MPAQVPPTAASRVADTVTSDRAGGAPRPFQESSIVHLMIGTEPALAPWLNVLRSTEAGGRHRVEVGLFSPTRELKERWQALYDRSG
ncbi:MAG TPA: hypothetical protein VGK73_24660 [Polyangiaceae bacterium]